MKYTNRPITCAALLLSAALAACNAPLPVSDQHTVADPAFGNAVRQARAQQTLNPQASRNNDPVAGIDGQSARSAIESYGKGFREPARTFNVLGIGSSGVLNAAP